MQVTLGGIDGGERAALGWVIPAPWSSGLACSPALSTVTLAAALQFMVMVTVVWEGPVQLEVVAEDGSNS